MSQNEESKGSTGQAVLAEVAGALTASASDVRTRLVRALTERELARRVDVLDKALVKRDQLQKEVYKMKLPSKPAVKILNADGSFTEQPATYTAEEAKKHTEEIKAYQKVLKEANEKLEKFDALMEEAFTAPTQKTFDKLTAQVTGKSETASE